MWSRRDLLAWLTCTGAAYPREPKPLERARDRKSVLVIGAGLAGLAAACELDRAGPAAHQDG